MQPAANAFGEGIQLDVAHAIVHHRGERDVAQPHLPPLQLEGELRLRVAVAPHHHRHLRARLAPQPILDVVHRQPLLAAHLLAVDGQDLVAGAHARVEGEALERAQHDHVVVVVADRQPHAAVSAHRAHRQVLGLTRILVSRVRVERAEHRVDAGLEELIHVHVVLDVRLRKKEESRRVS